MSRVPYSGRLRRVAAQWRAWTRGGHTGRSAVQDAEMTLALFIALLRVGLVAQMAPSLWQGIDSSPRPALYVACWAAAAAQSLATAGWSLASRRAPGSRWVTVDVLATVVIVLAGSVSVQDHDRDGTWAAFFPGYVVAVLLTVGVLPTLRSWLVALAALVAAVLIYFGPIIEGDALPGIASNLVTYVVVAAVTRVAVQALRRTAASADRARTRAAELARQDELRRARGAFHNGVAMMRRLADSGGTEHPAREELQRAARGEARRMRAYLRSEPEPAVEDDDHSLPRTLTRVCRGFDDLDVELVTDLAAAVRLRPQETAALETALTSLLLNVREHAAADSVVVHADVTPGGWAVTVHDDGRGFDARHTSFGVGLRDAVVGTLERRGMSAQIESDIGLGTMVTISSGAR